MELIIYIVMVSLINKNKKVMKNVKIGFIMLAGLLSATSCQEHKRMEKIQNQTTEVVRTIPMKKESISFYTSKYEFEVDGMEFIMFEQYRGGVVIINSTKEKLEIELLNKQLNK